MHDLLTPIRRFSRLPVTLFGLALLAPAWEVLPAPPEWELLLSQDRRDTRRLAEFLNAQEPEMLVRAAVAAGSLQDTALTPRLLRLLSHPAPAVRSSAAFALGQTAAGSDSAVGVRIASALMERLAREENGTVLRALLDGIGKAGNAGAAASLTEFRPRPKPDSVDGAMALAFGRMAARGIRTREAAVFSARLLDVAGEGERWKAAYALMRIGERGLLEEHVSRIAAAAQDGDPDVRMLCASALGSVGDRRVALLTLLRLASDDVDWRVRVNALKALAASPPPQPPEAVAALMEGAEDGNLHVSLAALTALSGIRIDERRQEVRALLTGILRNAEGRYLPGQQREAGVTLARLFGGQAFADLALLREGGDDLRRAYAAALAHVGTAEARGALVQLMRDFSPRVQAEAAQSLVASAKNAPPPDAERVRIRSALRTALGADDVAVLSNAAEGLSDSLLADQGSVPDLLAALARVRLPDQAEAARAIAGALGSLRATMAVPSLAALARENDPALVRAAAGAIEAITGSPQTHLLRKRTAAPGGEPDTPLLDWVRAHREVRVRTARGTWTMRLLPETSPFTCMALAGLIRRSFYDGLLFHRVVPNFVVQGGDPRGDGWGGPDFSLRSEFGPGAYDRGTVGMASSGKDTEGSQFFITHSRQPHLEGRYTIVATVIDGMEVVDRIQAGDRIEAMWFAGEEERGGGR